MQAKPFCNIRNGITYFCFDDGNATILKYCPVATTVSHESRLLRNLRTQAVSRLHLIYRIPTIRVSA